MISLFLSLSVAQASAPDHCPGVTFKVPHLDAKLAGRAASYSLPSIQPEKSDAHRTHAILYLPVTPDDGDAAYTTFYSNMSLVYTTLQRLGVEPSRIHPLLGPEPSSRESHGGSGPKFLHEILSDTWHAMPRDLNCDGVADTEGPALPSELRRVALKVRSEMHPGDRVLIYVSGHGGVVGHWLRIPGDPEGFVAGVGSEMNQELLGQVLDILGPETPVAVIMGACESGAALDPAMLSRKNLCMISSANAEESSFITPNRYSDVTETFFTVLGRQTPEGNALDGSADLNHDGMISLTEAFHGAHAVELEQRKLGRAALWESHPELSDLRTLNAPARPEANRNLERLADHLRAGSSLGQALKAIARDNRPMCEQFKY